MQAMDGTAAAAGAAGGAGEGTEMPGDAPGHNPDAASRLEELAKKGSGMLRDLLITSRAILAAGSPGTGSREYTSLVDEDLQKLQPAEQHSKLCERYLSLSKGLKELVAECETCGRNRLHAAAAAEEAAATQGGEGQQGEGTAHEAEELEAKAGDLRQRVKANNAAVLESMNCIRSLLYDMQLWDDAAREAAKPTNPTAR